MKTNHKVMMTLVAVLISLIPLLGTATFSDVGEVVEATTTVYHTVGKNRVKVIKNTDFVNAQGTKQSLSAEKGKIILFMRLKV